MPRKKLIYIISYTRRIHNIYFNKKPYENHKVQEQNLCLTIKLGRKDSKIEVCQKALKQIKDNHYADEYISNLDYQSVYIYGMCFHKKLCSVLVEQVK